MANPLDLRLELRSLKQYGDLNKYCKDFLQISRKIKGMPEEDKIVQFVEGLGFRLKSEDIFRRPIS